MRSTRSVPVPVPLPVPVFGAPLVPLGAPVVGPGGVAEDLGELVRVRCLDALHDLQQFDAVVLSDPSQVVPVATVGNVELVEVSGDLVVNVFAECFDRFFVFFVPGVAEPS